MALFLVSPEILPLLSPPHSPHRRYHLRIHAYTRDEQAPVRRKYGSAMAIPPELETRWWMSKGGLGGWIVAQHLLKHCDLRLSARGSTSIIIDLFWTSKDAAESEEVASSAAFDEYCFFDLYC